ncbi:MAG: glycosyltransferase family 39 protein [Candidatus Omnitrophota bacterium]
MKRIEIVFFIAAIGLIVFLHAHYMSGLYYDQDVATYVNSTLEIARGKSLFSGFRNWGDKPPGIYYIFLLAFSLWGQSFISIQIFSLIAKIITVFLLYLLAKYVLAKEVKFYYLLPLFYALFSSCEPIQSHTSNLETFLIPFEIAGILFLGLAFQNNKNVFYFLSGAALGLGFLIKQSALAVCFAGFVFICIVTIIYREPFRAFLKKAFLFLSVFLVPFLSLFAYLFYRGGWLAFIKYVFIRNIAYIKNISRIRDIYMPWSLQQISNGLKSEIIIFGLLVLIGLASCIPRFKNKPRLLALSWFAMTLFIISRAGFHLRHHFIEILPPFLTLGVIGISDIHHAAERLFKQKRFFSKILTALGVLVLIFPSVHIIRNVVKRRALENSFFATEKYLKSADKEKHAQRLLGESFDAGRRFLISQYVKERTTEEDRIFVWDGLATGSIYLWTQRKSVTNTPKFIYLPVELIGPISEFAYEDPSRHDYRRYQSQLLKGLIVVKPVYIVVIQSVLPMPYATPSYQQVLFLEKQAFKDFFDLLDSDYVLEKEILGCFAYRLKVQDAE